MNANIYRQAALDHLNSHDNSQHEVVFTRIYFYWYLLAIMVLLSGIFGWMFFGKITQTVFVRGIIISAEHLGSISDEINLFAKHQAEKKLYLESLLLKKTLLYQKKILNLADLQKTKDEVNELQFDLISLPKIPAPVTPLMVLGLPSFSDADRIKQDMRAMVFKSDENYFNHVVNAKINFITNIPITKKYLYFFLKNYNWVEDFFRKGAPCLLNATLDSKAFKAGEIVNINIIIAEQSPIKYLLR